MKTTFFIFFTLLYCSLFGQSQSTANAQVEYHFFSDSDIPTSYFSTLYIDNGISIFHEKTNENAVRGEAKTEDGRVLKTHPDSKKTTFMEPYLKIDHNKDEVLFFEQIGATKFLIQDPYGDLPWNITNETKSIEGFTCTKATVDFRGRKWIAWFTTELPMPFGPWKLHGLPGLIIEAYDATNKYTWRAVKIEYKKSDLFNKEFGSLIKTKNKNPITYQQFLLNTREYDENVHAEMKKKFPGLGPMSVKNNGMETKFEWDN